MILNVKRCLYTVDVFFLDFLRMKKLELPNPVIVFIVRLTGPGDCGNCYRPMRSVHRCLFCLRFEPSKLRIRNVLCIFLKCVSFLHLLISLLIITLVV